MVLVARNYATRLGNFIECMTTLAPCSRSSMSIVSTGLRTRMFPTPHQPSCAAQFDLDATRAAAPSFDKFCRAVKFLVTAERERHD
ncbi:hypothetical protein N7U49_48435 (plasmid) [Streptomyces sp. AD2-2]|nr:hypothetical protein N7U49_48435 [Streptomyces sp. AD2-2]